MGETRLAWTGRDLQFLGRTAWGEPLTLGGEGRGPGAKSLELVPLSLVACTAHEVVVILGKQRQELKALEAVVTYEQEPDPPWRFTTMHQHFFLTGEIDATKAERAVDLAESKYCAVAATLRPTVELSYSFVVLPG
jgi:putative redox protein